MKDIVISKFEAMRQELKDVISSSDEIKIGSLGPEGTTTYEATKYFIDYLASEGIKTKITLCLWNNFYDIHNTGIRTLTLRSVSFWNPLFTA